MARAGRVMGGARLAILLVGIAVSVESVTVARRSPEFSFASTSGLAAALELAAGGALIVAGTLALGSVARRRFGIMLATAGIAWLLVEWNNPGDRSALFFTAGLVLGAVCPVLVSHAVLLYPDRRLVKGDSIALGAGYAGTLFLSGLVPALFFDPARTGCSECPANLIVVRGAPAVVERASRSAVYGGVGWAAALIGVLGLGLVSSSTAHRRVAAPVVVPGIAYLGVVGADYLHSTGRGFLGNDATDRHWWIAQGALLVVLALGTGWAFVRLRLTRTAVARLVVQAAEMPRVGGLERALGDALGDASMRVLYPLADGRLIDHSGAAVELDRAQSLTHLTRGDTTVALVAHRTELLDADGIADQITATARLALDNERLQAQRQTHLGDLRASRARIVAAADEERRRLERDLHDGAQQKVVALSLALRLAQLRLPEPVDPMLTSRLDEAQAEVSAALAELRSVARGLYPRELADEGLAAGLETFAESSPIPINVTVRVTQRYAQPIEAAAYFAVAHCIGRSTGDRASVQVTCDDGRLVIEIEASRLHGGLVDLEDRVGALAGTVTAEPINNAHARIRVELPCAL
jgi:signal transduction histidine kinase